MIRPLIILLLLAVSVNSYAQSKTVSADQVYQTYKAFTPEEAMSPAAFLVAHQEMMGLGQEGQLKLKTTKKGKTSYEHLRYKQYYQDIPIYGSTYILHVKDGQVKSANGSILPLINLETTAALSPADALEVALEDMDAEQYSWEVAHDHSHGHHHMHTAKDKLPVPELVIIDKKIPSFSGDYKLCYKIEVYSHEPLDGIAYFVDAHSGSVVTELPLLKHQGVPGTGACRYYGVQEMQVDSVSADEYILFDSGRGIDGISVINFESELFTNSTRDFDYGDDALGKTATDAYYSALSMYDMLRDEFGWMGIDGENGSLRVGVNARDRKDYVNAYWNGDMAWIGNGDCNIDPLSTLDVVGHEFMHGVVDYTSDLVYREESGAINESMADVFGKTLEWHYDRANFSWDLPSQILLLEDDDPFRRMNDPESVGDPKFYDGDGWRKGGGVHTNSSVGNLFFVYLAEGAQGINEVGEAFNIPGLGMEEASKFIFFVNQHYLVEDSGYLDYYNASIAALDEFFDNPNVSGESVREAWKAVGLPMNRNDANYFDLSVTAIDTENGCGQGEYLSIMVEIANVGALEYTPSMSGTLRVDISNGPDSVTKDVAINESIAPGDTLVMEFDNLLLQNEDDFVIVDYELLLNDGTQSNNEDSDFVLITLFESNDLAIDIDFEDQKCGDEELVFEIDIDNDSCMDLPIGTKLIMAIVETATGDTLWSDTWLSSEVIEGNRDFDFEYTIPLEWDNVKEVTLSLTYPDDPNLDNNQEEFTLRGKGALEQDYLNTFSDLAAYDDGLIVTMEDRPEIPFDLNGEQYFVTTGEYENPFADLCFYEDREFDKTVGTFSGNVSASIETCVDLSDEDNPQVIFDFMQFRNAEFATDNTSALKVIWTDEDDNEAYEIIRGQDEGLNVEHAIDLPSNYEGPLEFRFVNHSGTNYDEFDFLDFDITLFDNLRFNQSVSTDELDTKGQTMLYPNPTRNNLYVASGLAEYSMQIFDLQGRAILSKPKVGTSIDVASLESGYYVVVFSGAEGRHQESFVKLDR